jgi:serine phosphatase RsbU (regulator of sigma subunit)
LDVVPFTIGRHSENHLILRDSRVSRRHAQIVDRDGALHLEDCGSLHGVRVNEVKVDVAIRLNPGDLIDFGLEDGYRLTLVEKSEGDIRRLLGRMPESGITSNNELAKLRALTEVARSLEHSLGTNDVLATVIEAALTVTGCERGFLLLEHEGRLKVELGRDQSGRAIQENNLPVPSHLIQRALRERKELLSFQFDPLADWSGRFNDSLDGLDLRSVLCVPLLRLNGAKAKSGETMAATMDDTVGVIYMDSRSREVANEQGNRELLQTLALEASTILENARLLEEDRKRQKMEQELALARSIQSNLLPRQLPVDGFVRAVGSSVPTHQVGGDFYDVLRAPDGSWMAAVADVSGKGVAAALLASLMQGVMMEAAASGARLDEWLPRANRFLLERTQGEKYSTLFACHIAPNGRMRFVNAGHSRPFLLRRQPAGPELIVLDTDGFPVGLIESAEYPLHEAQLEKGDTLVLFSDGVEEARRAPKQFFGRERIAATIMAAAGADLKTLHDALRRAVVDFLAGAEPHDDATLLLLRYEGEA